MERPLDWSSSSWWSIIRATSTTRKLTGTATLRAPHATAMKSRPGTEDALRHKEVSHIIIPFPGVSWHFQIVIIAVCQWYRFCCSDPRMHFVYHKRHYIVPTVFAQSARLIGSGSHFLELLLCGLRFYQILLFLCVLWFSFRFLVIRSDGNVTLRGMRMLETCCLVICTKERVDPLCSSISWLMFAAAFCTPVVSPCSCTVSTYLSLYLVMSHAFSPYICPVHLCLYLSCLPVHVMYLPVSPYFPVSLDSLSLYIPVHICISCIPLSPCTSLYLPVSRCISLYLSCHPFSLSPWICPASRDISPCPCPFSLSPCHSLSVSISLCCLHLCHMPLSCLFLSRILSHVHVSQTWLIVHSRVKIEPFLRSSGTVLYPVPFWTREFYENTAAEGCRRGAESKNRQYQREDAAAMLIDVDVKHIIRLMSLPREYYLRAAFSAFHCTCEAFAVYWWCLLWCLSLRTLRGTEVQFLQYFGYYVFFIFFSLHNWRFFRPLCTYE